jgi:DNA-binding MarR family transcriptional regulator
MSQQATIRVSDKGRRVLSVLLDTDQGLSGLDICRHANLGPGTIHPILARLERAGWIEGEWETPEPLPDRPRRRFYSLTRHGRTRALDALGRYPWNAGSGETSGARSPRTGDLP